MHYLVQNFAKKLQSEDTRLQLEEVFGEVMHCKNGEVVSVEEFVDGEMVKYVNNDDIPCKNNFDPMQKKADCLVR